jgi:hypothetical protein
MIFSEFCQTIIFSIYNLILKSVLFLLGKGEPNNDRVGPFCT